MANHATTGDTPHMSSTYYTSTTIPTSELLSTTNSLAGIGIALPQNDLWHDLKRQAHQFNTGNLRHSLTQTAINQKDETMARRIVQVFIADTDENVPLEKSVIYTGEQKLTDSTDQELFFEIDIKGILERHNAYRVTLVNKKVKERIENLEPVKIRELKMVVVNVAEFK